MTSCRSGGWPQDASAQARFIIAPHVSHTDLAQIRLQNALVLFDEFVHNTIKHPTPQPCGAWKGVLQSRWASSPATGARLRAARARSVSDWRANSSSSAEAHGLDGPRACIQRGAARDGSHHGRRRPYPRDGDERFIMGLVLTYYRRHPSVRASVCWICWARCSCPAPLPALFRQALLPHRW